MRQVAAVAAGGVGLALAFPSPDLHLLAWFALVPLFFAAREVRLTRAWWLGVLFGVLFRAASMYWVVDAMTRFGGLPLPAALAGAASLFLYLALFPALFVVGLRRIGPDRPGMPLLAAALWTGLELVQARLMTGFPWLLVGYAGGRTGPMIQSADLAGVFGIGFVVVAVNGAWVALAVGDRRARRWALAPILLLLATGAYGALRLGQHPASTDGSLRVALAQGNVSQEQKWDPALVDTVLGRYLELTERAARQGADLVVWPESAWPDPWGLEAGAGGERLRALAARTGTPALVGTVRVERREGLTSVANAALLVGSDGALHGAYEKVKLVPFGEYLPFRRWLGFLGPLVQAVGELRAGAPTQALLRHETGGVPPVGLSICYEIIFPEIARDHVQRGARLLVTITNDAWYGRSSAPWQHFAMARMRAVETRRWLVRAANTGISGIVDPAGRVTGRSGLFEQELIVGAVEPRDGRTLYVRTGDLFAWLCFAIATGAVVVGRRKRDDPLRSMVRIRDQSSPEA